jgi:NAD(P)-dependent dehydrogenase (short-subunit alcohol dehydrogenase family)
MSDRLKDKVALVSDAGSSGPGWGNGKATAVLLAREGAKVLKLTSTSMRPRDQADH